MMASKTLGMDFATILDGGMLYRLHETIMLVIQRNIKRFDFNIEEATIATHNAMETAFQLLAVNYPSILDIEYVIMYNDNICNFVPCNEYGDLIVEQMGLIS